MTFAVYKIDCFFGTKTHERPVEGEWEQYQFSLRFNEVFACVLQFLQETLPQGFFPFLYTSFAIKAYDYEQDFLFVLPNEAQSSG